MTNKTSNFKTITNDDLQAAAGGFTVDPLYPTGGLIAYSGDTARIRACSGGKNFRMQCKFGFHFQHRTNGHMYVLE